MVWKRENIQWAAVVWIQNVLLMSEVRGEWDRLVRDDRKTTVTQITTRYNQDLQNTISEHTTRRTLKQMGSSSRRPHRVLLRSDKNSTRRIQFTQDHQNWTIDDWKKRCLVWWVLISAATFRCRVRMWLKEHESMDPSCLVSTVQTGFLNMTMSSLYSNGLHSHQISIQ